MSISMSYQSNWMINNQNYRILKLLGVGILPKRVIVNQNQIEKISKK